MTSKTWQRWQDWLLATGGIWLFVSPWVLGTSSDDYSTWNAWTLGVLVLVTATWTLARPADRRSGWLQGLYGIWLFISPWALSFTGETNAAYNAWILGVAVVTVACWEVLEQALGGSLRAGTAQDDLAHGSH